MSRRTGKEAADRAAQNQQTLKSLVKLKGNKSCADCKKNNNPRWASWNLGVFVCIRCSGIHRGMGTHISRVKSVDLDAWTDEQLQSILKWGNIRANKYWEAKLAPGHVPSEAKIENFIRTKYESKRWVMDGGIPDPSTLADDGDEDIPLSVVQEKQKLDRTASNRASSSSTSSRPYQATRAASNIDLFGDDAAPAPRPSTTDAGPPRALPPKSGAAPAKSSSRPGDSLLGLDFFGPASAQSGAPDRPSSASAKPAQSNVSSRPDLKQSILSLYASAPRPAQQPQHSQQGSFSSSQPAVPQQSAFGGLNDAFSGLDFSSTNSAPAQSAATPNAPFSNVGNFSSPKSTPAPQMTSPTSVGGDFFNPTPKTTSSKSPQSPTKRISSSSGFDAFASAPIHPVTSTKAQTSSSAAFGDMFDFSSPAPPAAAPPSSVSNTASPKAEPASVFNLSAPQISKQTKAPEIKAAAAKSTTASTAWPSNDAWASDNAWSTPDPPAAKPVATATVSAPSNPPPVTSAGFNDFGWGSSATPAPVGNGDVSGGFGAAPSPPKVSADEDFGGWSSSVNTTTTTTATPKTPVVPETKPSVPAGGSSGGFGGGDDLFSNVWE
ncbi:MAG: hypothetical protein M1825_001943 [Sarcosagium campestre]|nr:MAG: hypothetical protein M1825_001943 [Sarcosagium campestre]